MVNAFNFYASSYWIGKDSTIDNYLIFYLRDSFTILEWYEFDASNGIARLKIWSFSGSNYKITWNNDVQTEYSMISNEIKYIRWSYGPYKCFILITISSTNIYNRFDVMFIELFCHLYPNEFRTTHAITCMCTEHYHFAIS